MWRALRSLTRAVTAGREWDADQLDWARIGYADAIRAIEYQERRGLAHRTINQQIALLRGIAKQSWLLGSISNQDYEKIRAIPIRKAKRLPAGREITPDEIERMLAACDGFRHDATKARNRLVLMLLYRQAMRRHEISCLSVEAIDLNRNEMRFIGKRNKEAELPFGDDLKHAISDWLVFRGKQHGALIQRVTKGGIVLPGNGISGDAVSDIVKRVAAMAGIDPGSLSPHDFRRSRATHLLDGGHDIRVVRDLMRHEDINTTAIYDRSDRKKRLAGVV